MFTIATQNYSFTLFLLNWKVPTIFFNPSASSYSVFFRKFIFSSSFPLTIPQVSPIIIHHTPNNSILPRFIHCSTSDLFSQNASPVQSLLNVQTTVRFFQLGRTPSICLLNLKYSIEFECIDAQLIPCHVFFSFFLLLHPTTVMQLVVHGVNIEAHEERCIYSSEVYQYNWILGQRWYQLSFYYPGRKVQRSRKYYLESNMLYQFIIGTFLVIV